MENIKSIKTQLRRCPNELSETKKKKLPKRYYDGVYSSV